jgi:hypothetical protein
MVGFFSFYTLMTELVLSLPARAPQPPKWGSGCPQRQNQLWNNRFMKHAFQTMRLKAASFQSLITNWAEMQLVVTTEAATLHGYGFAHDIAAAFSVLVLDWEAAILLPPAHLELPPGTYSLILLADGLFACQGQERFWVGDGEGVVEVVGG